MSYLYIMAFIICYLFVGVLLGGIFNGFVVGKSDKFDFDSATNARKLGKKMIATVLFWPLEVAVLLVVAVAKVGYTIGRRVGVRVKSEINEAKEKA